MQLNVNVHLASAQGRERTLYFSFLIMPTFNKNNIAMQHTCTVSRRWSQSTALQIVWYIYLTCKCFWVFIAQGITEGKWSAKRTTLLHTVCSKSGPFCRSLPRTKEIPQYFAPVMQKYTMKLFVEGKWKLQSRLWFQHSVTKSIVINTAEKWRRLSYILI